MRKIVISVAVASVMALGVQAGDLDAMIGKNFFDSDAKLDDALSLGLRYSHYYQNSPWGAQIGFDRIANADIDIAGATGDIDANRYFINALYGLGESGKLKTFLLGGLGYEDVDSNFASMDSQMFANLGIGLRYALSECWSVVAEAKYIRKFEDNLNDFALSLGLGYSFGKAAPKPAPTPQAKPEPKPEPAKITPTPAPKPEPKDSDNDGVINSLDKCPDTPYGTKVGQDGCPLMIELDVYFDTDKSNVKAIYFDEIDKAVSAMKQMPWVSGTVVGHTDSRGSNAYNQKLSQKRADAVMAEMVKKGVEPSKLQAVGKGESEPVASNETDEGRAKNRRVEVHFNK